MSSSAFPQREVEITVYDRPLDELRVFRCNLRLLERSMKYFVPIIKRYLKEEEEEEEKGRPEGNVQVTGKDKREKGTVTNTASRTTTTTTNGNNNTNGNSNDSNNNSDAENTSIVSGNVALSSVKGSEDGVSSKRKQQSLPPPIPLRVNCDMNVFSWLMAYIEGKQRPITPDNAVSIALSSNFLLMTQLVDRSLQFIKDHLTQVLFSGVNMECFTGELLARLSGMLTEGDVARAFTKLFEFQSELTANRGFLTALLRHVVCDRFGQGCSSGLRWCRYCGVLFDYQEYKRVTQRGKNVKPIPCPRLGKNSMGPHGEILTTHAPSQHSVNLTFPTVSWSDERVERWAWRLIGTTYFFSCRHCNIHVSLIGTVTHDCRGGMEKFSYIGGGNRTDGYALLAWYSTAKDLYVGGLTPVYSQLDNVPRESFLELSDAGEWSCDDGSERTVPGLWCTHPIALERAVDEEGRVSIDNQNGFERWFAVELQRMMDEFDGTFQPSNMGSETRTPTSPPVLNYTLTGPTGAANVVTATCGGSGAEVHNGAFRPTCPPFRGGKADGRMGVVNGNDSVGKRHEVQERMGAQSVKSRLTRTLNNGSKGVINPHPSSPFFSSTTRLASARAGKFSMQNTPGPSSGPGKCNPSVLQAQR